MKYIYILLLCMLWGCSSNKKQQTIISEQKEIPMINLSENISEVSSLPLSEVATNIEFVQLESTDESYLGEIQRLHVTEHDIWIEQKSFFLYLSFFPLGTIHK